MLRVAPYSWALYENSKRERAQVIMAVALDEPSECVAIDANGEVVSCRHQNTHTRPRRPRRQARGRLPAQGGEPRRRGPWTGGAEQHTHVALTSWAWARLSRRGSIWIRVADVE